MYNKLFSKIVTSSVWLCPTDHRIVWITFLALMDQDGFVAMASVANLAHTARVSLEAAQEAVKAFESPDPHDPEQEFQGRRIERVPSGWMVLNAEKYRNVATAEKIREQTRLRNQAYRQRKTNATMTHHDAVVTNRDATETPSDQIRSEAHQRQRQEGERASQQTQSPQQHSTSSTGDARAARSARAQRFPDDFNLTPERRAVAEAEQIDAEREFTKFADHWRAAGGANARKADWDATWRNWCKRAADYASNRRNGIEPPKATWRPGPDD
jgi:site-specific DNA-cytosine methylase